MKINGDKSTAVLYTRKINPTAGQLQFKNTNLRWQKIAKYLEVILDSKLT